MATDSNPLILNGIRPIRWWALAILGSLCAVALAALVQALAAKRPAESPAEIERLMEEVVERVNGERRPDDRRTHQKPAPARAVLEGRGEAWLEGEDGVVCLEPGVSIALPANRVHAFRVVGDRPLITFGIHASDKRIVNYVEPAASGG